MSQRAFFLLFALGIASTAYGQTGPFSIEPSNPQYLQSVNLRVNQQSEIYTGGVVSMADNTLTVTLASSGFTLPPGGGPFEIPLGQFPSGNYDVNVVQQGGTTPLSTLHFQVAAAPAISVQNAQVVMVPASPKFGEPVHVTTPNGTAVAGNYMPSSTTVTMSGNTITVAVVAISFESSPGLSTLDAVIGRFPTGSYDVRLVTTDNLLLGTGHFVVADRDTTPTAPIYDYTDMWWTPTESGWGLSLSQHSSTNLFAAWFVYGSDGRPVWYVLPNGTWSANLELGTINTYSGQVYKTSGPYYGGPFLPSNVAVTPVGTAQLKFSDYSHGTLIYTVDGVTGLKAIERQPF